MIQWDRTPTTARATRRREEDKPGDAERMHLAEEAKAAVAMLLLLAGLIGAWLLGAGWRP